MRTLVDVFRSLEEHRGEFVIHDDGYRVRRFTYAQVTRAARGFAGYLEQTGLRPNDKMLLWGENAAEWLVCYWGAVIAGIIVVPIDYRSSLAFAARIASIVDAKLVCAGQDVPGGGADGFPAGVVRWRFADLDWTADGPMPAHAPSRDDIAQIVFTSGATAEPKGVVVRHKNLLANLTAVSAEISHYGKWARPVRPLRFLNLLPLSHLFGQAMATNIPPLVDGTVVFMRSVNPHDIVPRVKQWRVSVIVCVPKVLDVLRAHVVRLDRAAETPAGDLSIPARWWRYRGIHRAFGLKFWAFVVGAAPLGSELEEFWKRLGFVVIQGYGLTETAPIVTLNHPFRTRTGTVGTPVDGVEVRIAGDGEILVRGENVTEGYFDAKSGPGATDTPPSRLRDAEAWLHTGDVGELDAEGRLFIRGRKKEMIVTADGLNVFPDDVERVLNAVPGVVESAVVGRRAAGSAAERAHAVLVLEPGITVDSALAAANARLADHQRVRSGSVWTSGPLPRTEGTQKIKRAAIRAWLDAGASPDTAPGAGDGLDEVLARFTAGREAGADTTLETLGLSSLERVELMVAIEDRLQTRLDESRFASARTLGELRALVDTPSEAPALEDPVHFPRWNRRRMAGWIRRASLATWILPALRLAARVHVRGLEHLRGLEGPVVFASNHQSHLDVPVVLSVLPGHWRARVAPAMAKEFFKAHFFPQGVPWRQVFTNRANYYLAAFFFNAFPLPQREAGARQTLRYIGEIAGEGFSVLIFPEGVRSASGDIKPFRGGIGMIAARLGLPVVPVRLDGVDRILPTGATRVRPGTCSVSFGKPLRLRGDDYAALAREVEKAVRNLPAGPRA